MRVHSLVAVTALVAASSASTIPRTLQRRDLIISPNLPAPWTYLGCFLDDVANRQLAQERYVDTTGLTQESCVAYCDSKGYRYAGLEYSYECFCADVTGNEWTQEPETDCSSPCAGDATEACGGPARLTVFDSGKAGPIVNNNINGWASQGCYTDNIAARSLSQRVGIDGPLTVEKCTSACAAAGYLFAGVEYGSECYCDSQLRNGATTASADTCDFACAGDSTSFCGGASRLNLYKQTNPPATPTPGAIPPGWTALPNNCYVDDVNNRNLPYRAPLAAGSLTIEGCLTACQSAGYTLAGVEYAQECYCGNSFVSGGPAPDGQAECNLPCRGNVAEICGGANRLNVYSYASQSTTTTTTTTVSTTTMTTTTTTTTTPPSTTTSTTTTTTTTTPACTQTPVDYGYAVNGGFEDGLSNWSVGGGNPGWTSGLTSASYNGCKALYITSPGTGFTQQGITHTGRVSQIPSNANNVRVSFLVGRPAGQPGSTLTLAPSWTGQRNFARADVGPGPYSMPGRDGSTWQRITLTSYSGGPYTSLYIFITDQGNTPGNTLLFDDLQIQYP